MGSIAEIRRCWRQTRPAVTVDDEFIVFYCLFACLALPPLEPRE